MYDKTQIIAEIRRVAESLKTKSLKKKDFIKNTMIPISTINFYISSWHDALLEAGLEDVNISGEQIKDKELLKDLLRIEKEFGETPTYALIEKNGKFSKEDYEKRWRNLDDAFKLAKSKYQKKVNSSQDKTILMKKDSAEIESLDKTILVSDGDDGRNQSDLNFEDTIVTVKKEEMHLEDNGSGAFSDDFVSDNILTIDDMQKKGDGTKKRDEPEPSFDYIPDDDGGIENLMDIDVRKRKKKKIVPETVKPRSSKSAKTKGKPLDFRGIKFAPIDTRGVIYIFGMVSEELNFVVESFETDRFCFSGKRNLSSKEVKWEAVNIGFALDSLDLKKSDRLTKNCELLVCWKNGWSECPVEVLELSSSLSLLDNY